MLWSARMWVLELRLLLVHGIEQGMLVHAAGMKLAQGWGLTPVLV